MAILLKKSNMPQCPRNKRDLQGGVQKGVRKGSPVQFSVVLGVGMQLRVGQCSVVQFNVLFNPVYFVYLVLLIFMLTFAFLPASPTLGFSVLPFFPER